MFKRGDKIVCITHFVYPQVKTFEVGKIYTIKRVHDNKYYDVEDILFDVTPKELHFIQHPELFINKGIDYYFISLKEYRKQKLNKLCSNYMI